MGSLLERLSDGEGLPVERGFRFILWIELNPGSLAVSGAVGIVRAVGVTTRRVGLVGFASNDFRWGSGMMCRGGVW